MSAWLRVKASARDARRAADALAGPEASLDMVLQAAYTIQGVAAEAVAPSDPLLGGGEARLDCESIGEHVVWYPTTASDAWRRFLLAHELAHATIHTGGFTCGKGMIDPVEGEEQIPDPEGYSPRQRKEREANVWGREFLLPAPTLRARHLRAPVRAHALATEIGLDERLVRRQMARALLTVEPDRPPPAPGALPILDDAQRQAVETTSGPTIIIAGPGTGKTTTLAARIGWLLDQGVPPESITAVTFSRRAADEMRERVVASRTDNADGVRLDTLHAYCLDLLRRHGPWPDAGIVDDARAAGLVERLLPHLGLQHLLYLPDPPARVKDALDAIARAKCTGVSPEAFVEMAAGDLKSARAALDEALRERRSRTHQTACRVALHRAERVEEVGRIYRAYQRRLEGLRRYDFGDVLIETARLLEANPDLIGPGEYRHLLVDEFQDLNRAALRVVLLIAGSGRRFWGVGDPHQLVYRFQGADAQGVLLQGGLFPGATIVTLDNNRRSRREIVDVVTALVPHMHAAPDPDARWHANRGPGGTVTLTTAESPEAELAGLTAAVRGLKRTTPYRDQAVLARRHVDLVAIAEALEAAEVPVLFLAGFFERSVVRDMLALLELTSEPSGRALIRVAAFPEYDVPRADVLTVLAHAKAHDRRFPAALALARDTPGLSAAGARGLALLQTHLAGITYGDHPWQALTHYLFDASDYLAHYPADDSLAKRPHVNGRQRAALFQLLQLASSYSLDGSSSVDRKRTFLAYVRSLAGSTQHRQLAQPPDWAAPVDAVRLLTVHAAKGLEFDAVHVPRLNVYDFHTNERETPLVPDGCLPDDATHDHDAEEECILFVALSRARDHLALSRAETRRNWNDEIKSTDPVPLLVKVRHALPSPPDAPALWRGKPPSLPPPSLMPLDAPPAIAASDLEAYAECPRRFAYTRRFGLAAHTEASPYRRLVGIVQSLLRDVADGLRTGNPLSEADAVASWHHQWSDGADATDPYDPLYRDEGERRILRAFRHLDGRAEMLSTELVLHRPRGTVQIDADVVLRDPGGRIRVQRWIVGTASYHEKVRLVYAVLHHAGLERFGRRIQVGAVAVATHDADDAVDIPFPPNGLAAIDRALDGLSREDFPARPNPRRCHSCPFYFLCPS